MSQSFPGYTAVSEFDLDEKEHRRKLAKGINGVLQGKLNAVTTLTLTANAATSTITDARLTPKSFIGYMPTTANASAEIGAGTIYISARTVGSATVTHANNAQVDRTYTLLIIG